MIKWGRENITRNDENINEKIRLREQSVKVAHELMCARHDGAQRLYDVPSKCPFDRISSAKDRANWGETKGSLKCLKMSKTHQRLCYHTAIHAMPRCGRW